MRRFGNRSTRILLTMICITLLTSLPGRHCAGGALSADESMRRFRVYGGLCVQVGAHETDFVIELASTGRFLVHVLDRDQQALIDASRQLKSQGLYGLASVDRLEASGKLPYTENLVNLLIVLQRPHTNADFDDIYRVVCPNGVVLAAPGTLTREELTNVGFLDDGDFDSQPNWIAARKPWPAEMDQWSHPRHSASGNAVSEDQIVGPPRRIRWLSGPWEEVSNMVSADGRNYYGGLLTRDSFNGLRLWQRAMRPSSASSQPYLRPISGVAPPVAGNGQVYMFIDGDLRALDGGTGQTLRTFSEAERPVDVLYDDGILISVGIDRLHAFDAESGRILWIHQASEPRYVVAGGDTVGLIQGSSRRGEPCEVVALEKQSGKVRWTRKDLPWAAKASRCVYYQGMLTFEVSTMNDLGPGNAIHILAAADGQSYLDHEFLPGMNHVRQARPLFVNNTLWLLHGGKDADENRQPTQVSAIDYLTGEVRVTHPAGLAHCFPPVATPNYLFSGELDLTDLRSGKIDANRITKAACGRDNGWVPANGLIYVTPKHCVCWPMLRGYAALASARPGGNPARSDIEELQFPLESGAVPPLGDAEQDGERDWPCYRHDAWRSGSTTDRGPSELQTLWSVRLDQGQGVTGPITQDWNENPYVKGPITAPVIADETVFVARPDAHEVVALDAATGQHKWRFTANGRVDTPPTIHGRLCLFGAKSGWVYCLRSHDGQLVWRRRVAPLDERIVAYGGLESPWPVPGSVLVIDDVAYFAAGRQSLADGGILVFAVEPATGEIRWTRRLDTVPQQGFYRSSGLEFDNFDLLFRQGDDIAMSRWVFERKTGEMTVDPWAAFARLNTGGGSAMVPQGCWSYAPRNQKRTLTFSPRRPLVVFRDKVLYGCLEDKQSVYRRDFDLEGGEEFDEQWITGWSGSKASREGGLAWRSERLSSDATWSVAIYDEKSGDHTVTAMVLAADHLYVAGSNGQLRLLSVSDGKTLAEREIAETVWDGLAVANGRMFAATVDGKVLCLGEK